ncbi:MAG: DoxX family protein [Chitinophagales bacterium]|nr:DoxX family protein [Chitinophagales bacterium]
MSLNFTSIGLWILRLLAAVIMLQTLYFKFTGAEESVYIFSQLGIEPWGRIGTGLLELVASILILYPRTTFLGAALGAGLMIGAIGTHLFSLGIVIKEDGGLLFTYALIVFVCCSLLVIVFRNEFTGFLKHLLHKITN